MATRELAALFGVPAGAGSRAVLYSPPDANANLVVLGDRWLTHAYAGMITGRVVPHDDPLGHRLSGVNWTRGQAGGWHQIADTMPVARLVTDVRVSTDILQDLRGIDISRTALVGEPLPPLSGTPGDARVTSHRPGRIIVRIASDVPALLVLTETFDAGWSAADGTAPLKTIRVNGDYLGAVVPAGARNVIFSFSSADTRRGILLSMAGLFVTAAAAAMLLRRRD